METKTMKFQEAMNRLDEIVTKLNKNDCELEDAMNLFTEGLNLCTQCEKQLKSFEKKISELTQKEKEE